MANTEMLIRLRELHEELSAINDDLKLVDRVDEETIDALGQLVTDVSSIVDQTKETSDSQLESDNHRDMFDRISEFESSHPRVTQFLSQVTDLLAMMGI